MIWMGSSAWGAEKILSDISIVAFVAVRSPGGARKEQKQRV